MDTTQVRCGIKMTECVKVADNLAVGIDDSTWMGAPIARLFDPNPKATGPFRGYVSAWRTPKRGKCFRATVFNGTRRRENRVYQTREGAIAGMVRIALRQQAQAS